MSSAMHANLVGITGIARRLVMDGALAEEAAREAMAAATQARKPLALYLVENRLVAPVQLAAANSVEFGMPIFDLSAMDPNQSAIKLVSEELVRKHSVVPLFKRGGRLFVGISDPTNTRALDELKFATNLAVEPILVDEERIKHWLGQGALPTDRVARFLDQAGLAKRAPRNNPEKAKPGKKAQERIALIEKARADAEAAAAELVAAPEAPAEENAAS